MTEPKRDVGVVIVAAGSASRTGARELKQFRWVGDKPMLLHSVLAFQRRPDVAMVVCVLPQEFTGDPPAWLFQAEVDRLLIAPGGRERGDSVRNGLQDLPPECEIVVIHDAARPFVRADVADRVVEIARSGKGAVAAIRVADTVKRVDSSQRIVETIDRTNLWRAQTPQAFPRTMIERAYAEADANGVSATDDAALCERLGLEVLVVEGSESAVKITMESDFARAQALGGVD